MRKALNLEVNEEYALKLVGEYSEMCQIQKFQKATLSKNNKVKRVLV